MILNEDRSIKSLWFPDDSVYTVGQAGVSQITPYKEPGEMGMVIWFAVYRDSKSKPSYCINSKHVEGVGYE